MSAKGGDRTPAQLIESAASPHEHQERSTLSEHRKREFIELIVHRDEVFGLKSA